MHAFLVKASRDEERVQACVERTIPAVEELLRPVVVGRVPISAPQFFRALHNALRQRIERRLLPN